MARQSLALRHGDGVAPDLTDYESRANVYGGLVGQMIDEIDARLNRPTSEFTVNEAPDDFLHAISVACGYIGLALGFGIAGAWLLNIL